MDLLEQLVKDCSPRSSVIRGGSTPGAFFRDRSGDQVIPDLIVQIAQQTFAVDVAVSNPAAISYIIKGSDREKGVAAAEMENKKLERYSTVRGLVESGNLVPFVVEATGFLGKRASSFLDRITDTRPDLRNRFIDQMNVVLNHAIGQMHYHLRDRLVCSLVQ
jgi:hypothetical protein